jgi:hypothetical protein
MVARSEDEAVPAEANSEQKAKKIFSVRITAF